MTRWLQHCACGIVENVRCLVNPGCPLDTIAAERRLGASGLADTYTECLGDEPGASRVSEALTDGVGGGDKDLTHAAYLLLELDASVELVSDLDGYEADSEGALDWGGAGGGGQQDGKVRV